MTCAAELLAIALAFLLGAIPFSFLLAKLIGGVDIRTVGSGNIGATNLARSLGIGKGIFGLALDAGKGAAAVLLARRIGSGLDAGPTLEAVAGGAAPFLSFKGGKGVATGAGVFGVLAPGALLAAVVVFMLGTALSRMVSLGSVLGAVALPIAAQVLGSAPAVRLAALFVALLVVARHRANLQRIARGTERRLGADPGGEGESR
jgi:acyl phosphate:glycerol-3-phosphate acyltransferase